MPDASQYHVDIHCHLGLGDDEFDLIEIPRKSEFDGWLTRAERKLAPVADGGLRVLLAPIYYTLSAGIEDVRRLNDLMIAAAARPEVRGVAVFGVVEPHHGEQSGAEIDRIAGKLAGIVFSARAQGIFADTPELPPLITRAAAQGLLTMVHATPDSGNEALWRIWNLAEQCEDVPIVALGALSGWENVQAIIANPGRALNLHYDTGGLANLAYLPALVAGLGPERLLFGSGAHDARDAVHRAGEVDKLIAAGLEPDQIHAILRGNAERLLKLTAEEFVR